MICNIDLLSNLERVALTNEENKYAKFIAKKQKENKIN
jgi:hypothetical protein